MHRRQVLSVLLAISTLKLLPLTSEQVIAQTPEEVEALLKNAYSKKQGKYLPYVMQHPKEVAEHLSIPLSDDAVRILSSINEQIIPIMDSYADFIIGSDSPAYTPAPQDYFGKILEEKYFDINWYRQSREKAAAYGIELSPMAAHSMEQLGNRVFALPEVGVSPEDGAAVNPIIVGAIVVVIVFGPRRHAEAVSIDEALDVMQPYTPVIDPKLFEKY